MVDPEPNEVDSVQTELAQVAADWMHAIPFTREHEAMLRELHKLVTQFAAGLEKFLPVAEQLAPMLGIQIPK